ncbi:amino acid ABC transporter substrate-binding protein [Cytobacillus depressus]|uniref:Amino acid ABC transporter substrate-binding protein n=1 Tax=Cytobacillus depressus TaxID=1602942 RepID=A0A6L3V7L8_9BACI|nr:ABC transporter substrate-binding protein [Cytobacillus depressus]KAB2336710.1 amino acid ABC transporter substrate-binding protein [Cytobacillus depressus]
MMKKLFISLMVILLIGTMVGCSGSQGAGGKKQTVLERVEKSKVLKVGFEGTYPPFNFIDDKQNYIGFDVDVSNELAKRLGVEAEFIATKWDSLIGGVKADKFDIIIAQMTVTDERKKSVDFTDPYVVTGSVLVTREGTNDITKLEDIKGKNVGVGGGTTFEEVAKSVDGANVKLYKSVGDYIQDLQNKRLDVIINDQLLMGYNIKENKLPIKITSEILNKDEIGMAIKKDNEDFVKKINETLAAMKEDGTYDEIYKKWFGDNKL